MAEIRRQPFQTVKVDIEEMDRKIREHRIRMLKRAGIVLGLKRRNRRYDHSNRSLCQ